MSDRPALIDSRKLCLLLKISKSTLMRYRRAGLPCYRPSPGICRYSLQEVDEWLNERQALYPNDAKYQRS